MKLDYITIKLRGGPWDGDRIQILEQEFNSIRLDVKGSTYMVRENAMFENTEVELDAYYLAPPSGR